MSKRSYQQYCPLAYGLDAIGERWTLLIVRELGVGPRRFSDLQRGLPGMGPNLLSSRLKSLEKINVITTIPLPPPARVQAYILTESGQVLLQALGPLAQWGVRFLPAVMPDDVFIGAVPAIQALRMMYQPDLVAGESLAVEVHLPPDVFSVQLQPQRLLIEQGYNHEAPISLQTSPSTLIHVIQATDSLATAATYDDWQVLRGTAVLMERLLRQFVPPTLS